MRIRNLSKSGAFAALLCLLFAASAPDARADFNAGWETYQRGDFSAALDEWQPLAEAGDTRALFNLGTMYDEGKGVVLDQQRAVELWAAAAESGYARAQHNLANAFISGDGAERNMERAAHWLHAAAATTPRTFAPTTHAKMVVLAVLQTMVVPAVIAQTDSVVAFAMCKMKLAAAPQVVTTVNVLP